MEWVQLATSFAVWVAYGIWLRGKTGAIRKWAQGMSRTKRAILGAGFLFLSAVVLLGGLMALNLLLAPRPSSTSAPISWLTVTFLGVVFVHLQVLGASVMIAIAQDDVASKAPQTSNTTGKPKRKRK